MFYYCEGTGCGKVEYAEGLPSGWIKKYDKGEELFFCSPQCAESHDELKKKTDMWKEKRV